MRVKWGSFNSYWSLEHILIIHLNNSISNSSTYIQTNSSEDLKLITNSFQAYLAWLKFSVKSVYTVLCVGWHYYRCKYFWIEKTFSTSRTSTKELLKQNKPRISLFYHSIENQTLPSKQSNIFVCRQILLYYIKVFTFLYIYFIFLVIVQ